MIWSPTTRLLTGILRSSSSQVALVLFLAVFHVHCMLAVPLTMQYVPIRTCTLHTMKGKCASNQDIHMCRHQIETKFFKGLKASGTLDLAKFHVHRMSNVPLAMQNVPIRMSTLHTMKEKYASDQDICMCHRQIGMKLFRGLKASGTLDLEKFHVHQMLYVLLGKCYVPIHTCTLHTMKEKCTSDQDIRMCCH